MSESMLEQDEVEMASLASAPPRRMPPSFFFPYANPIYPAPPQQQQTSDFLIPSSSSSPRRSSIVGNLPQQSSAGPRAFAAEDFTSVYQPISGDIGPSADFVSAAEEEETVETVEQSERFVVRGVYYRQGSSAATATRQEEGDSPSGYLYAGLGGMLGVSVLCNFDHGAIPATLGEIRNEFHIGYVEQSLLGSLVYFGLIIGTLMAGLTFQRVGAKWLVAVSLVLLAGSLYMLSSAWNLPVMYVSRFLSGLFQAMPVVYLPVWVDEFAPEGSVTKWMSYTQLASIFGTVMGYFLAGVLGHCRLADGRLFVSWRTSFLIQSLMLLVVSMLLAVLPERVINLRYMSISKENRQCSSGSGGSSSASSTTSSELEDDYSLWNFQKFLRHTGREVARLLRNPLYVIITLGMSNLYFVLTGVQFWVTEYMTVVLHHDKFLVVSVSTIVFLTAPTTGVAFGGYICDAVGGYRGGNQKQSLRVATAFAGLASLSAVIASRAVAVLLFVTSLWGCLFFGAALVPLAVGMILSCVPPYRRSLSSAVSQLSYNLMGWFAAPLLSGIVMDIVALQPDISHETPLKIGFCLILLLSILGFVLFAVANLVTLPEGPSQRIAQEELGLEVVRRRTPSLTL